jgi:hypothetical protein
MTSVKRSKEHHRGFFDDATNENTPSLTLLIVRIEETENMRFVLAFLTAAHSRYTSAVEISLINYYNLSARHMLWL